MIPDAIYYTGQNVSDSRAESLDGFLNQPNRSLYVPQANMIGVSETDIGWYVFPEERAYRHSTIDRERKAGVLEGDGVNQVRLFFHETVTEYLPKGIETEPLLKAIYQGVGFDGLEELAARALTKLRSNPTYNSLPLKEKMGYALGEVVAHLQEKTYLEKVVSEEEQEAAE